MTITERLSPTEPAQLLSRLIAETTEKTHQSLRNYLEEIGPIDQTKRTEQAATLVTIALRSEAKMLIDAVKHFHPDTVIGRLQVGKVAAARQQFYRQSPPTNPGLAVDWQIEAAALPEAIKRTYPELALAEAVQTFAETSRDYRDGAVGGYCGDFQAYGGHVLLQDLRAQRRSHDK